MTAPLVTIGVTAFNAETTIARALASALAQDWPAVEIVVVDDASSDATVARIEAVAQASPQVRLIRHPENRGVAAARNSILEAARGEFVAFFDDDDESLPHRVTVQVARIGDYERDFAPTGPVVCHAARRQVAPDGATRIETTMGAARPGPAPSGRAVADRILAGRPLPDGYGALATCSQMARLAAYRMVGGFDPAFRRGEDTDLAIRWALAGAHFVGVAEPLVVQTLQVTSEKSLEIELGFSLALLDKHREVFGSAAGHAFARDWMRLKFAWLNGRRAEFAGNLLALGLRRPRSTLERLTQAAPMSASRASSRRLHAAAAGR